MEIDVSITYSDKKYKLSMGDEIQLSEDMHHVLNRKMHFNGEYLIEFGTVHAKVEREMICMENTSSYDKEIRIYDSKNNHLDTVIVRGWA